MKTNSESAPEKAKTAECVRDVSACTIVEDLKDIHTNTEHDAVSVFIAMRINGLIDIKQYSKISDAIIDWDESYSVMVSKAIDVYQKDILCSKKRVVAATRAIFLNRVSALTSNRLFYAMDNVLFTYTEQHNINFSMLWDTLYASMMDWKTSNDKYDPDAISMTVNESYRSSVDVKKILNDILETSYFNRSREELETYYEIYKTTIRASWNYIDILCRGDYYQELTKGFYLINYSSIDKAHAVPSALRESLCNVVDKDAIDRFIRFTDEKSNRSKIVNKDENKDKSILTLKGYEDVDPNYNQH